MNIDKFYIHQALKKIDYQPRVIIGENADLYRERFLTKYIPNLPKGHDILYWDYLTGVKGYYCDDDAGDVAARYITDLGEVYFFIESNYLKEIYVFENGDLLSKFLLAWQGGPSGYISDQSQSFFLIFSDENYVYSSNESIVRQLEGMEL
jgi:hypothetical protein